MKKLPKAELVTLLQDIQTRADATVHALYPLRDNPSVTPEYHRAVGRLEAVEAMLAALRHRDSTALRLL